MFNYLSSQLRILFSFLAKNKGNAETIWKVIKYYKNLGEKGEKLGFLVVINHSTTNWDNLVIYFSFTLLAGIIQIWSKFEKRE